MKNLFSLDAWNTLERNFLFMAFALALGEFVIILMLLFWSPMDLAATFGMILPSPVSALGKSWMWLYRLVGPMIFPLTALMWLFFHASSRVVKIWKNGLEAPYVARTLSMLEIVEYVAPALGFCGTAVGMIKTLYKLDPCLSQTMMIRTLLDESGTAFAVSVLGIGISILAVLSKKLCEISLQRRPRDQNILSKSNDEGDDNGNCPLSHVRKEVNR